MFEPGCSSRATADSRSGSTTRSCSAEALLGCEERRARSGEAIWLERQQRFWNTHLGRWLGSFATAMAAAEAHPLYSALAELLQEFTAREATILREA